MLLKLTMKQTKFPTDREKIIVIFFIEKGNPKASTSSSMDTDCFGTDGSKLTNTF